jgi:peroxiredoxin Q/BCP
MLQAGQTAPDLDLPDADMEMVSLSSFKSRKNLVLYFYLKDDTPGCTTQALELSDLEDKFTKLDTVVLGVSRDDCLSHGSFRDKHGITVRLLSDSESEACKKYDVLQEKKVNGETKLCVLRSTFIIDKQGVLRHALYGVSTHNHATEVLRLIKEVTGVLPTHDFG